MNNWRLLLLALAAVFQPIASFTERNLVDGRRQCCDHLSSPLQDTRSSFHGTHRLEKTTTPALRRLNDRDENRQDRHNELRQRDSVYNLPLTERRLLDIRASGSRLSDIGNGFEYRLERRSNQQSRDRLVDVHERGSSAKVQHLQPLENGLDDTSRTRATQKRNNHGGFENLRVRTKSYGNERQSKNLFDSHRGIPGQQIRSGELRLTLNRDARHIRRQSIDEESRIGAARNMINRPHIMSERSVRFESSVRANARRNIDNSHERRQLERYNEQRRSLSEDTPLVHRIRDMRIRVNFRDENRQRLSVEKFGVRHDEMRDDRRESRQHNKENTDRNLFGERIQMIQRTARESRIVNKINNEGERNRETRDEFRENPHHRITHERIQMDRRNNRIMNNFNRRDVNSRRENRNNERISRDNTEERENHNNLQEKIQIEQTNFRDFRIMNDVITRNGRDIDSIKSIRYNNRLSRETRYAASGMVRENSDQRYSRDMIQNQQRNIRELRIVNTLNERDIDSQRQIRYNEKRSADLRREIRSTDLRREIRENPEHRLPSERVQMNRRHIHESRIINSVNERGLEMRPEIRHQRISREIRENSDRRNVLERRQVDRRDIRESRIMNGVITGNARENESKREFRYDERLSRQVRGDQLTRESRAESRVPGRMTVNEQRDNSDRRTRSADSRNFRQIRTEPKLSRSAERRSDDAFRSRVEHSEIENREREVIESRSYELARNRESISRVMARKVDPENDSIVGNWQYVLYTLQAAYLCTLLMQILTPSRSEKPHKMNLRWLRVSSHYNPIKVD